VGAGHAYLEAMLRRSLTVLFVLAFAGAAMAAEPADTGSISIMKPEPGTQPAHKKPHKTRRRGSSNPVYPIPLPGPRKPAPVPRIETAKPGPKTSPPLYVPQTGRLVPNLPAVGSGPGGAETFQDRSARCVHQSGINAATAGDPGTYIRSCVNQ
jgi:hypothetical protein